MGKEEISCVYTQKKGGVISPLSWLYQLKPNIKTHRNSEDLKENTPTREKC